MKQQPAIPRPRRNAFTLVELLTAIAIIAILISMAFLGYKYVSSGVRGEAGNVGMQTAKALLAEYEAGGGNMDVKALFKKPGNYFPNASPPYIVNAPGQTREGEANRFGYEALATHRLMRRMAGVPACNKMLANLPDSAKVYPTYQSGITYFRDDELMVMEEDVNDKINPSDPLSRGKMKPAFYRAKGETTNAPPAAADWQRYPSMSPLLLDGDRNVILFIPGGGLANVTQGGTSGWRVTSIRPLPPTPTDTTTNAKPFFVSPGPDGDYKTGDDNVYSFSK